MCGFTGFIDNVSKKDKNRIIKKMNDTIVHRGPDGEGYYTDNNIAMGFRRLSIIDLVSGDQPLFNEDKSLVISFNGEIYNYKELRDTLIKKGHKFKTSSDTEVIIHGYEEYGEEIVPKLRGMFAFVIWDNNKKELFGAKDPFGIKPFYYYLTDNLFIYGSEIKSFLMHPNFKKELNEMALKTYLTFQYSTPDNTFFKNVYKLNPGHYFKYSNNNMDIKRYFEVIYENKNDCIDNVTSLINETIKESIAYHKISDVPVGAFLSSGVDSSYIVSNANIKQTFTVGFKNDGFDETKDAKDLCKILKIKNESKLITKDMFFDIIPKVQYHSDEPHANLSAVPLYYLANMASKKVKVVLSGEGADELFGGYSEYNVPKEYEKYNRLPFGFRKMMAGIAKKLPNMKGKHFLIKAGSSLTDSYIGQAFIMNNEEANEILTSKYQTSINYQDITKKYYGNVKNKKDVLKKMYLDMKLWMPYDILLKADKMTMANSLELRVPFLDKEVFKMSSKIPTEFIVKDHVTKYAFRMAANKTIPEEWANRPKLGFLVPFKEWLHEDKYYNMVKKLFNEEWVDEFFKVEKINELLDEHYNNKWNNGRKIYTIYCFLVWYKIYFKGEKVRKGI